MTDPLHHLVPIHGNSFVITLVSPSNRYTILVVLVFQFVLEKAIPCSDLALVHAQVPPAFDAEGFWQPSYLNMNASLNRVPGPSLQV